jgi:Fe-Mn family superoxide dismutase
MTLHHTVHHQAYVNNLNIALESLAVAQSTANIAEALSLQSALTFNAGGHINHTLFWSNLAPASSSSSSLHAAPKLSMAISSRWGSIENFQDKFSNLLLGIKGSGWGWLVLNIESGSLELTTTKDQDVVPKGKKQLIGIDMWEHAFYLQYLTDKKSYIKSIWQIVNWEVAEGRYIGRLPSVFEGSEWVKGVI